MGLTESAGKEQPGAAPPRRVSLGWTLGLTSLATFMVALDALVVITALPSIGIDFKASVSTLQWTINAYGLTWASGIITAAALGDRFGRRRVFISGVALFTLASAACAIAPNMGVLIASRAVQGFGAAIILPLSLTILAAVFPPEKRSTMIGIWGGIGGLAVALGPLVGGVLTQDLNWHWVFWVNVPIGAAVLLFSTLKLVESHGPQGRLDLPGVVLAAAGAVAIIWALVQSSGVGWSSPEVIGGLVGGFVLIGAFVYWEGRAPQPMLPLRLFRNKAFSAANITSFAMTGALVSSCLYLTEYFQSVRGDTPLNAGVRLLPMLAMPLFVTPLAGVVAGKVGPRTLIVGGLLIECVGLGWFAAIASTSVGYSLLIIPMVLTGIGLSLALATTPTAALGAVQQADMGKASGVNSTLTRFGGAFGVAITTAAFAASEHIGSPSGVMDGIRPALLACAGFALIGALSGLAIRRAANPPVPPQMKSPSAPTPVAVDD